MSCSYAEGLSPYENKGKLGLPESVDNPDEFDIKVKQLAEWIEEAKHVVIHTGAGISTAAGIPDFRGPNGVWTLEKKGIKPKINISFDDARPTPTHMAILELVKQGKVHYVVSQNIDALHLRSGLSRKHLAELHGNMYVDQCNKCERQFVRKSANKSVGQKNLNIPCPYKGFRPCRGTLHDTILDWEHNLPQKDINLGDYNSSIADLSICLGTTLQINPSGMLPIYTKKYNQGKLVICNLSSTKHDKKADLVIRGYVDDILVSLMQRLNLTIPGYNVASDPSRGQEHPYQMEWTLLPSEVQRVKRRYEQKMRENKNRKVKTEEAVRKTKLEDKRITNVEQIGIAKKEEITRENIELKQEEAALDDVSLDERKAKVEKAEDVSINKRKAKIEKAEIDYVSLKKQKVKSSEDLNKVDIFDVEVILKKQKSNFKSEDNGKGCPLETKRKQHGETLQDREESENKDCLEDEIKLGDEERKPRMEESRENGESLKENVSEIKENIVSKEIKCEARIGEDIVVI